MSNAAPSCSIVINGRPLSGIIMQNIIKLTYSESIKDTAKLSFAIGHYEGFDLTFEDVRVGSGVKLSLGYGVNLMEVFAGEIVSVQPNYEEEDTSLNIEVLDRSYLLKKKPIPVLFTADKFPDLKSVAEHIVRKHDLDFVLNPQTKLLNYKLTDDQGIDQGDDTDWSMLDDMARTNNYKLFVRDNTVYMVDTDFLITEQLEKLIFEYRPSEPDVNLGIVIPLKKFDPRMGVEDQREAAQLISWTPEGSSPITEDEAALPDTEGEDGYTDIKFRATTVETIRVKGNIRNKAQAQALVEAELQRRAENIVTGSGTVQGLPTLKFGQIHIFRTNGLGDISRKYSGTYHITEVTHEVTIDGGFVTGFRVRRNGLAP